MRHLSVASLLACVLVFTAVIVWLGLSSLEAPDPAGRSAFPAEKAMATLKKSMTPEQIAEAKKRASLRPALQ